MTTLLTARMESDFSEWTSETDADGDLNWAAAAGMAGSAGGAQLLINNSTSMSLAYNLLKQTVAECRFYIDPNTLTMSRT